MMRRPTLFSIVTLLFLLLTSSLFSSATATTPQKNNDDYLQGCADSFSLMPHPLIAIDSGELRWGVQFSVFKTLLSGSSSLFPFIETGVSIFNKIQNSEDTKHLFWSGGLLYDLGPFSCSFNTGLLYGNKKFGPTFGVGIWKFFSKEKEESQTKKPSDFKNFTEYLSWKRKANNQRKKRPLIRGYALSLRINYNVTIEPMLTTGLFFDIFF